MSAYLFIHPSVYIYVYLFICAYPCIYPSILLSIYLSLPSIHPSIHPPVHPSLISLSVSLSSCLSFCYLSFLCVVHTICSSTGKLQVWRVNYSSAANVFGPIDFVSGSPLDPVHGFWFDSIKSFE
jgi:hypothetical protein